MREQKGERQQSVRWHKGHPLVASVCRSKKEGWGHFGVFSGSIGQTSLQLKQQQIEREREKEPKVYSLEFIYVSLAQTIMTVEPLMHLLELFLHRLPVFP
ncbi:hypothetical protein HPP92_023407 [Vanilla planifolia]|uniref:Uncharacterized protein n=1 Tax=Vanilla planifolia TaxID=51239 RepID=A0A835PV33_VANPL|nr:hypothetical protein HPP92_023407 [Vanilla planifolia]